MENYVVFCYVPDPDLHADFTSEKWLEYAFRDYTDLTITKPLRKKDCGLINGLQIDDTDALLADALLYAQQYIK